MLAIRLPETVEQRLDKLARRTGRTKTYYAREAILEHLSELEDVYLAEETLLRIKQGRERVYSLAEVTKELGSAKKVARRNRGKRAQAARKTR